MEFGWTEEQVAYRTRVKQAIEDLLPDDWFENYAPHSYGSAVQIEFSRKFCPQLAERGLLTPHWPKEWGGGESEPWNQFILAEEMKAYGEPRGPQYMNTNWIGPTLMRYGSPEQQAEHLPRIARGEAVWCQGYSEPGAGTDLANLRTRAELRGDHYVINGSKIWTSYSRKADHCFLLARTGQERKAISIFIVPMNTPGISVTPFPGMVMDGHLNEVFFSDVEVPVSARLGEEGRAWDVITYALSFERVGIPRYHMGQKILGVAMEQLKAEGRFDDPVMQARAGKIMAKFEAARLLTYAVVQGRVTKNPQPADGNISRIAAAEGVAELMNFLMDYLPDCLAGGDPLLMEFYRTNISSSIAAGTYEIQLNLIAQVALGLPRGA